MARKPRSTKPRKAAKSSVKAAADRAEKRSKGEDVEEPKVAINPPIERAPCPEFEDEPTVYRVGKTRGRPSLYKPEYCETAASAALNGATDEEIAEELGIDGATFYRWRARYPEFRTACQWGKDNCDERVERSLYARAVGYTYETVKIMQFEGKPVIVAHKEHIAPDVSAAKMWLTNRKRKDWADRQQHEHGQPGDFDRMTDEELEAHIKAEAAAVGLLAAGGSGKGKTRH